MARKPAIKGEVKLLGVVQLLHRTLDEALCEEVFRSVRGEERERRWTLFALVRFWTAVILRAPRALTAALQEARRGEDGLVPQVEATSEAFFQRCRDLPAKFFAELYRRFLARVLPYARPVYAQCFSHLRDRFPEIWVVDGSKMEAVAHRLRLLWNVRSPVLGGCVSAFYDLFRGITRGFFYFADAAVGESSRTAELLDQVVRGTLLLGDRLYCSAKFFAALTERHLYGLMRRNKSLGLRRLRYLQRSCSGDTLIEDILVEAGSGQETPPQSLRRIRLKRRGRIVMDLLTNVLDPKQLSVQDAFDLYPMRWTVERLFFDLKLVLKLKTIYASNPNAIAMQAYAAALVHVAMRVAQGRIAADIARQPEELSPAKLFPKLADASRSQAVAELTFEATQLANPNVRLRPPLWERMHWSRVQIKDILVEPRKGPRRRRRFCDSRRRWKSFAHVPGGAKLT